MADRIQQRRDTKARWEEFNPVLLEGEVGYVTDDPNLYKIGDGINAWNDLPYRGFDGTIVHETGDSESAVMSQKAVTEELSQLGSKVSTINTSLKKTALYPNTFYIYNGSSIIKETTKLGVLIQITAGEVFQFSGSISNYVYLSNEPAEGASIITKYSNTDYMSIAPEGSKYVLITLKSEDSINVVQGYFSSLIKGLYKNASYLYTDNVLAFVSIYGCPIIDINVISNGGYDKIFLAAAYNNGSRLLIQFRDENKNILCQSYISTASLIPSGKTILKCSEYNNSGVEIDVYLNVDSLDAFADVLTVSPVIKQKTFDSIPIEYIKKVDGSFFYDDFKSVQDRAIENVKTIDVNKTASDTSSSRFTQEIDWNKNIIKIKVEKEIGNSSNYSLYTKGDSLTLIKDNLSYDTEYIINIESPTGILYLFSSTINTDGFVGKITYSQGDSIESRVEDLELKTLKGYNIVCLGDSITEFRDSSNKRYSDYLAEFSKANIICGGIGGTRYAQRNTPTLTPSGSSEAYASLDMVNLVKAWTSGDWSYVDAANEYLIANSSDDNTEMINNLKDTPIGNVDVVTLFAGTNDLTGNSIVGELSSEDSSNICGAINIILKSILNANPNIRIFIFTPTVRYVGNEDRDEDRWSDVWSNTKGVTLADICETISNCAKRNHIPVCDMYWGLGWNRYNFSNYFYDSDNTHPYKGFSSIAKKMYGFIIANRNF